MPIAKVQMPDGRIGRFEVPEGTTPDQVIQFAQGMGNQEPQRPAPPLAGNGPQMNYTNPGYQEAIAGQPVQQEPQTQNLQQRAQGIYGFDPNIVSRGAILPVGKNKTGETVMAVPQIGVDLLTSSLLPGQVMKGGEYQPQDVTKFALDFGIPALMGKSATGPVARTSTREFIRKAPTTEQLSAGGGGLLNKARDSGLALNPDKYVDFLANVESKLVDEGIDPMLHSKAYAVFDSMVKKLGQAPTIQKLMIMRRQMGTAASSVAPELADERRIAKTMIDALDDMIDNLVPQDLAAGPRNPELVASQLNEGRALWSRAKKSDTIEKAMERAQHQASGVENGMRVQFRRILNNPKLIRGFSPDEVEAIKQVANGTATTNALRLLGKLSFGTKGGSNFLGGTIGVGAGSMAGGPVGAMLAPVIGYGAQKAADASTSRAAELARALAASGVPLPDNPSRLADMLMRGSPATAGTQIQVPKQRFY